MRPNYLIFTKILNEILFFHTQLIDIYLVINLYILSNRKYLSYLGKYSLKSMSCIVSYQFCYLLFRRSQDQDGSLEDFISDILRLLVMLVAVARVWRINNWKTFQKCNAIMQVWQECLTCLKKLKNIIGNLSSNNVIIIFISFF